MTAHSRKELEEKENVVGTYRSEDADGNEIIVALVKKKVPESQLADEDIVDKVVELGGTRHQTDVEEVGIPHLQHRGRYRPSPGGVSIGTSRGGAGTMGPPLLETEDGDAVFLTNRHVAKTGNTVYQPALLDNGSRSDQIGEVIEHSNFDPNGENICDSALISVNPDIGSTDVLGIGPLNGFREASFGEHTKAGRTTGVTTGRLRGRDGRVNVRYGDQTLQFTGLDIYDHMSEPGDSGSLIGVLDDGEFFGTSLLFAGSNLITLGIPMSTVMDVHGPLSVYEEDVEEPEEPEEPDEPEEPEEPDPGSNVPWWYSEAVRIITRTVCWLWRVIRTAIAAPSR